MDLVYIIGVLVVLIAITVVPVMIAAKWARARRSGFFPALAAVVLATLAAQLAIELIQPPLLGGAVALIAAFLAYALVLGTSFVAAVGVAVVALVLQLVIIAGLVALGMEVPMAVSPTGAI